MASTNFNQSFARLRDEEIIRIAHAVDADGYLPEAIEAAKAEIARRGLSESAMSAVIEDAADQRQLDSSRHLEPLGTGGRIGFALGAPFFWLSIFVAIYLGTQGYQKKRSQAFASIAVGLALYAALAFLITHVF